MPLSPGQGPEQGAIQSSAERGPREVKQYPITVDDERTFYPENYPHQFIVDGPPASIRRIMGGIDGDRSKLGPAINAYLRPSQEVFSNTPPDWYNQTLAPILERMHLSLDNLKPEDLYILGDNFRGALERVYDFSFPKDAQIQAARNMGQTEGTVPTLSALMQELRKSDSIRFEQLMTSILEKGPDGLVMAAYLTAPKPEEHAEESEINFDKAFSVAADGRIQIDPKALEALRNVSFEDLRKAFEKRRGNISYDAWRKLIDSAEREFDSQKHGQPTYDLRNFYTPDEAATITSTAFAQNALQKTDAQPTQQADNQPVLDSQGQSVSEYITQDDPRYADLTIPDYLKVGTPDYVIRQAQEGNYIDPDELKRALAAKRNALAANTFDSLIANQNQAEITEGQDTSRKSFTSYGPNGEPYRMIGNPPPPEREPTGFDAWKKIRNTTTYKSQEPITPDEEK